MPVQIIVYREFYTEEIIDETVIDNIRIQQHIIINNSGQAQAWGATDMPGRSARNDIWMKSDLA